MSIFYLEHLYEKIKRQAEQYPHNADVWEDLFECVRILSDTNKEKAQKFNLEVRERTAALLRSSGDFELNKQLYDLQRKSYLLGAKNGSFSDYLFYIEWNREPAKRFYQPRMKYLAPMVEAYQDVHDGKLDLLTISQPKRTGKSQTGINYVNFISGEHPERSTLMEGTGDALVKSFYDGCLEILLDGNEYLHHDVFENSRVVGTNADLKVINLQSKKRFPTIMCRSIDASQVGLSEATNLLYLDDLVQGREEALDRNRLDKKWEVLRGDVLGRRIEGTPIVAAGTRYSLYDPIGKLQEIADDMGWRWRAIEIPALDIETDESNYEHERDGKKIFTTEYLRHERDMLSEEQWESEFQQQPFEARGLMFPEKSLNRYFKLPPDKAPDAVIAACDTADKGSDSVMLPVAYLYGEDVFIEDCVFDNGAPGVTKPRCAKMLFQHKVARAQFESNNAGEYYARDVEEEVKRLGGNTSITLKRSIANKHTRIEMASDNIIKHFYFKHRSLYKPSSDYGKMMKELTTYTRSGKNAHDDAPDGMAMLENMIRDLVIGTAKVVQRPF